MKNKQYPLLYHNDTNSNKLKTSKSKPKRLTRFSIFFVIFLISASSLFVFWSSIKETFIGFYPEQKLKRALQEQHALIKKTAYQNIPVEYFSGYSYSPDSSKRNEVKFAKLIHKFANDFYGRPARLSITDEMRIFAYIDYFTYNTADLCNLNSQQSNDTTSLRNSIIQKVTGYEPQSPYYNPVIHDLLQTSKIYEYELEKEFERPFDEITLSTLTSCFNNKDISQDSISARAIEIMITHPELLVTPLYYKRILGELSIEVNLRLAIIYSGIGKDYGVKRNRDFFGWFRAGYRGKSIISKKWTIAKWNTLRQQLRKEYKDYEQSFADAKRLYRSIDLDYWHLKMYKPLPLPLSIKEVGLFGARRTNGKGKIYEHHGIDLAADDGTPVYPVQDGFVIYVGNQVNGWGNHIEIWHDANLISTYSHLQSDKFFKNFLMKFETEGPFPVTRGTRIASVGRTGNIPNNDAQYGYSHLHLEVKRSGHYINPLVLIHEHFKVIE